MRRTIFIFLVLSAWLSAPSYSQTLQIPGAGPPEAPLRALAAEFERANPGLKMEIPPSTGIAGGLRAVLEGDALLARIARRLKDDELGKGLKQLVYAADPVVFAVGTGVTVKSLSADQLAAIFSGRTENWSALGGEPALIRVFYREPTEIAHRELKRHVLQFESLAFSPAAKLVNADFEMVEGLSSNRTAIGWLTLSSVNAASGKLRALDYEGIAPSPDNVRAGRYKMVVEHVLIYREDRLNAVARRFIEYLGKEDAARVLARFGVVHRKP